MLQWGGMNVHLRRNEQTLYGEIAEKMLSHIELGIFRVGEKVPSLRAASSRYGVSLNTIKEAYFHLEDRGFLESRPQSGFFVKRTAPPLAERPAPARDKLDPKTVSICSIYSQFIDTIVNPEGASLAVALPSADLLPSQTLSEAFRIAFRDYPSQALGYRMSPGWKPLREEVSRRLLDGGALVSPDDLTITNGASEAILLCVSLFCSPGDTVAVESPTYFNFLHMLALQGLKVLEIPGDPNGGMNLDILEYALGQNDVKAVIAIPNFSNPLGTCMSQQNKERLVSILEYRKIPLIEDDTYGELSFDSRRHVTCKAFDKTGNVFLCGSLSKTLSPGLRIGWVTGGPVRHELERVKTRMNVATGSANQIAASLVLSKGGYDRHLKSLKTALARQSGLLRQAVFDSFPSGTRVSRPGGGLVLWVELETAYDTDILYRTAIERGILFAPGSAFTTSGGYGNCLRLNAGCWNDDVRKAVFSLGELAQKCRQC